MPNYTGFEIIDFFEEIYFKMIFVTAYDKYAIKAFEVSAVDYLLKPIEIERLQEAVERASKQIDIEQSNERIGHLTSTLKNDVLSSLIVTERGYQYVVLLENVIALEAQESYCCIHSTDKSYMASKNLKHFEKLLADNKNFIRVHKSWIINLDHMLNYSKSSLEINLTKGIVAKLSKYKKTDFESFLS
jgi:two-component system LytT family response regulator